MCITGVQQEQQISTAALDKNAKKQSLNQIAAQECATNSSSGSYTPIVPSRGTDLASSQLSEPLIYKLFTQVITIAVILCKYSLQAILSNFLPLSNVADIHVASDLIMQRQTRQA